MLSYVGYTEDSIDDSCTYNMAVMEGGALEDFDLFSPTFVSWWPESWERFGLEFDPEVEREVSACTCKKKKEEKQVTLPKNYLQ